jgi:hypothetical protein
MIRQGDVLVMRHPGVVGCRGSKQLRDEGWKDQPRDGQGRVVLAAGEVTGHHHAIHAPGVCFLRKEGVSDAVMTVGGGANAELVHEEHSTIAIPSGRFVVRIQREWGGEVARRVED